MQNSLHIKIENSEALNSKKDLLLIEKSLLEMMQAMKNYDSLRKKELVYKLNLKKDLTSISSLIIHEESILPRKDSSFGVEKTEIVKEIETSKNIGSLGKERERRKDEIKSQIDDIKEKLARLNF